MSGEDGYTLTELMVALIVGSLILSYAFTLFTFTQRLTLTWQRKVEARMLTERTVGTIAEDICRSKSITVLNDTVAVIEQDPQKKIIYRFAPAMVFRNDDPITVVEEVSLFITLVKNGNQYVINAQTSSGHVRYQISRTVQPVQSGRQQFISGLTDGSGQ